VVIEDFCVQCTMILPQSVSFGTTVATKQASTFQTDEEQIYDFKSLGHVPSYSPTGSILALQQYPGLPNPEEIEGRDCME
jgi:hypothetical protein